MKRIKRSLAFTMLVGGLSLLSTAILSVSLKVVGLPFSIVLVITFFLTLGWLLTGEEESLG